MHKERAVQPLQILANTSQLVGGTLNKLYVWMLCINRWTGWLGSELWVLKRHEVRRGLSQASTNPIGVVQIFTVKPRIQIEPLVRTKACKNLKREDRFQPKPKGLKSFMAALVIKLGSPGGNCRSNLLRQAIGQSVSSVINHKYMNSTDTQI